MVNGNDLSDLEKDPSVASSAEDTENSHPTSIEDGDSADAHDEGRQGKGVVSSSPICVVLCVAAVMVVVALVVAIPTVLIGRDGDMEDANENRAVAVNHQVVSSPSPEPSLLYDTFEYTPEDKEQCPGHLEGEYFEVSQVWALDLSFGLRGAAEARTFEVEPSHTVLPNGKGVVFNVETVTEPLPEDASKPVLTATQIKQSVAEEAAKFYHDAAAYPTPPLPNVTFEVVSLDDLPMVYSGNQGFLAACMMAFAQHLPLALSPDHIWTIIVQGFARHVDQYAEELRANFVDHQGKKQIVIRQDRMVRGQSPPKLWEELIFPLFSQEIGKNMNNQEAYETLSKKVFSTSTATTQAASEIVLMAAMKNFFEYTMVTACGIPQVRLEGTRDDWVALRNRSENLAQWMMPNSTHGELWIIDIVLPILDQFVQAYDGNINYCFWQTMVKFRTTGGGSGSYEFLSGWLGTLFPYLSMGGGETKPNPFLRSWEESASALMKGPQPNHVPSQLASVPVKWIYFEEDFPLHFHAGFRGVTQEADGTVAPALGYYVTNDPEE